ncbi:hypothetical protein EVA_06750, partial [gut metagenome]
MTAAETTEQTATPEKAEPVAAVAVETTTEKDEALEKPVKPLDIEPMEAPAESASSEEVATPDSVEEEQPDEGDEQTNETRRRRPRRRRRSNKAANGEEAPLNDVKTEEADAQNESAPADEPSVSESQP